MTDAVVVISDLHVGSLTGLCPPWGIKLDNGSPLPPSKFQEYTWQCFDDFWRNFVPKTVRGCQHVTVVINGDAIEGNHHNQTDNVPNIGCQRRAAADILKPIKAIYKDFRMVRGTETHGGISEEATEAIAETLGCPQETGTGNRAWWQLWIEVGGELFNIAHHIGTTSSTAYESSAPMRELVAGLVESAQWDRPMPDVFVRSHRHRFIKLAIPSSDGEISIVVTPAWQLRTPHVEKNDRMRVSHIGGVVFLCEDKTCQIKQKIYSPPPLEIVIQGQTLPATN